MEGKARCSIWDAIHTETTADFLIGAGGTGGYVLAYLARLLSSLVHRCSVTVIDGDTVAKHNLERQNFIQKI